MRRRRRIGRRPLLRSARDVPSFHDARHAREPARTGVTPWADIVVLYERLLESWPTVGAQIAHAVALAHARASRDALQALDAIDPARVRAHQPWWAARAHVLALAGRHDEAVRAFDAALALTRGEALRRHLAARREVMGLTAARPA